VVNQILIGLFFIMKSVISSALQLMLQVMVAIVFYLVVVILTPHGLLSSIVAIIPLALSLALTLSGVVCLIYLFIFTPILQLIFAFKREGIKQYKDTSNTHAVKKLTVISYLISVGNGLLMGLLTMNFIL
jgi:hypothetical protein